MEGKTTVTWNLVGAVGAVTLVASACVSPARPAATSLTPAAPGALATQARTPTAAPRLAPNPTPTTARTWTPSGAPEHCVPPEKGEPQDIVGTPTAPYFVRHPAEDNPEAPTIVFLGGGSGSRRSAERLWTSYLSGGRGVDDFRIVLPYSNDLEYSDPGEAQRTFRILDEVLACYGGDPAQVHLAGFSNGGYAAFELMLQQPDRFATLLGAPGLFPLFRITEQWAQALCGHAIFNGVGSNDVDWKQDVRTTHENLLNMGLDSVYVEFAGQGHRLDEAFDETVFFDFWRANGPGNAKSATAAKGGCCI
ncbi:MAG: hypothetical protein HYY01_01505 [Chloroflexi bacterium]|nr:hypothetical protein [Chloroflexota bacterium]